MTLEGEVLMILDMIHEEIYALASMELWIMAEEAMLINSQTVVKKILRLGTIESSRHMVFSA